jgi:hypothetical protein
MGCMERLLALLGEPGALLCAGAIYTWLLWA